MDFLTSVLCFSLGISTSFCMAFASTSEFGSFRSPVSPCWVLHCRLRVHGQRVWSSLASALHAERPSRALSHRSPQGVANAFRFSGLRSRHAFHHLEPNGTGFWLLSFPFPKSFSKNSLVARVFCELNFSSHQNNPRHVGWGTGLACASAGRRTSGRSLRLRLRVAAVVVGWRLSRGKGVPRGRANTQHHGDCSKTS